MDNTEPNETMREQIIIIDQDGVDFEIAQELNDLLSPPIVGIDVLQPNEQSINKTINADVKKISF